MKSTTIQLSDDYLLHVTVRPVVGVAYDVKIESQWLGAKDPEARQVRYSVTLLPHDLMKLAAALTPEAA